MARVDLHEDSTNRADPTTEPVRKDGGSCRKEPGIAFLGQSLSADEYREACENLQTFFQLLRDWREQESNGDTKTTLSGEQG
ncbi:MAG: hypothetical protein KOO62_12335 [candidate division Zixibacteria bacterium]|nr:hypothetical protein [candidate division Zixibacteria bacterium]